MALKFFNRASRRILNQGRNIRYSDGSMLFGFYNVYNVNLKLSIDLQQIAIQADVFARQILLHRSEFDLKRFLGQYQDDWLRLLSTAYVGDRLKAIFYGVNSSKLMQFPQGLCSFPGNIYLSRILSRKTFSFSSNDEQPTTVNVTVNFDGDLDQLFEPIFVLYPELREGYDNNANRPSYVNSLSESILRGLFNGSTYLQSRPGKSKKAEGLYDIYEFDSQELEDTLSSPNNPILNSYLSEDLTEFFFIMPDENSGPNALRFCESTFLSRAIGMTSNQVMINGNPIYTVVKRDYVSDKLTKDEVYSITALKSEITPYSMDQIKKYLSINSYSSSTSNSNNTTNMGKQGGGNTPNPPSS